MMSKSRFDSMHTFKIKVTISFVYAVNTFKTSTSLTTVHCSYQYFIRHLYQQVSRIHK